MTLPPGYVIRLTALDPATGTPVPGITVTDVSFFIRPLTASADGEPPMPLLVPSDEAA
jgi:hypothetical protein